MPQPLPTSSGRPWLRVIVGTVEAEAEAETEAEAEAVPEVLKAATTVEAMDVMASGCSRGHVQGTMQATTHPSRLSSAHVSES